MQYLAASPLQRQASLEVSTVGAAVAARLAMERMHALNHEFILHFDVDVINSDEFPWTDFPGSGGLSLREVREALRVFVSQQNLAAFVVAGYNPELDSDGKGARQLIDLLADVLPARLETSSSAAVTAEDPSSASSVSIPPSMETSAATLSSGTASEAVSDRGTSEEFPDATDPDANVS
jgi:hypothetical protein